MRKTMIFGSVCKWGGFTLDIFTGNLMMNFPVASWVKL